MTKLTVPIALVALLALGACNTVEGAGKDMKSAGRTVTKSADEHGAK